ncbi:MAG: hypothetical protein IJQ80_07030, partial [Clostridia bacterium]|nr:hypothetical protein [Clostridia bacterium]
DSINAKDLKTLKRLIVGDEITSPRFAVDLNDDGRITTKDSATMKKIISGVIQPTYYGNAVITKSIGAEEGAAALTVTQVNTKGAFFDVPLQDRTSRYVAFVMKDAASFSVAVSDKMNMRTDALSYDSVEGNNYSAYIAYLPEYTTEDCLEITFDAQPTVGETVYIDSMIFADTLADVRSIAGERVEARKISDPEEFKYVTVNFDSPSQASRVISKNNTTASYDSGYNALKLQVTGSSADPWALVNLEDLAISADEYKYIVYNSMIPSGCHQATPEGEIFYSAGSITQPTGGYSNIYSQFSDSKFHSSIFEMTNAAFWTGTVHSLRFDYYCACAVGDSQYVRSVTFCNSYRAAAAICADRTTPVADIKSIFFYGKYDDGSFKLSYRMYVPYDYDGVKEYPFLMLLHGAGERGTDGTYHLQGGFPYLFNDTTKSTFKNIVFAPQCPKDIKWVDCDWTYGSYNLNNTPESKPLGAAMNVVYKAFLNYKIDRDRVYVSGLSMGGYGSWDVPSLSTLASHARSM